MEDINDWLAGLRSCGKGIVVEGLKDTRALRGLGVKNQIYELSKKPIFAVIEEISSKETDVIILTDFDRKGKELYGKLNSGLQRMGVEVDNQFREWLQRNTRVSHIEGLQRYVESTK